MAGSNPSPAGANALRRAAEKEDVTMPPLQSERDRLNILCISQDASAGDAGPPTVNFEMSIHGETAFRHSAPLYELGFHEGTETLLDIPLLYEEYLTQEGTDESDEVPIQETKFSLPAPVDEDLDRLWLKWGEESRTLWLDLDSLDKRLAVVPW